ncbi:MAG: MBOAT family O-acyltransferase [Cyanobacteria bacterium P01_H01_bin.15]
MNYSDFSFWWILLIFSVPFFSVRALLKSGRLWPDVLDAVGLASLSLILFANASFSSFFVFVSEIIFNYVLVQWMLRFEGRQARLIATVIIVVNIAILAYFKYLTFFVEDVFGLFVGGVPPDWPKSFPLPVFKTIPPGVSFYTFQMVAFVVDSLTARKKKPINFLDYLNFVAFFPQIVAGPIERRISLFPQIQKFRFKFTWANFVQGFRWLSLGAFMKFVLGDNIAPFINVELAANAWGVWFHAFLFTLRIYFDFAGYSFMALGIAYFLGVKLTINFLAPYTSQSINEFWRRWHITLSTWFRDYVFVPLMGSRKQLAPFFLFLTFTLSGFWHGAAWNFILWGAYHGALLLALRYLGRPFQKTFGGLGNRSQTISWALTFGSVVLGCLFFMDTNITRLGVKLQTLLTPGSYSWSNFLGTFTAFSLNEGVALSVVLGLAALALSLEFMAVWQKRFEYELLLSPWLSPCLLGLTVLLAANTPSQFIYFEF